MNTPHLYLVVGRMKDTRVRKGELTVPGMKVTGVRRRGVVEEHLVGAVALAGGLRCSRYGALEQEHFLAAHGVGQESRRDQD